MKFAISSALVEANCSCFRAKRMLVAGISKGRSWFLRIATELCRQITNFFKRVQFGHDEFNYCRHNKQLWKSTNFPDSNKVVVLGLFDSKPSIVCYAFFANELARFHEARIASYSLVGRTNQTLVELYASFGARLELRPQDLCRWEVQASQLSELIIPNLKTKSEVLAISVEGVCIGDILYDSYLRYYNEPTLKLQDDRFHDLIKLALQIFFACKEYITQNEPVAFITDDYSYLNSGIMTRLMHQKKVPIYMVCFGDPFYILRLEAGHSGAGHGFPAPVALPCYKYAEIFASLTPEQQSMGIEAGRKTLQKRLSGDICPLVRMSGSAFTAAEGRILEPGDEPRILVLMHDFVDSPHGYREMMFPDFWEWITFLLDRAAQTNFRWYVKPHPCLADPSRRAINEANQAIVEQLKKIYPTVHFLDPTASNARIVQDGISAMYTVHGTSAHEFAYLGVPVVNCGDNPHISYNFNIHARTIDEYEDCIAQSDKLDINIEKTKIEEFVYMHYLYFPEKAKVSANPFGSSYFKRPDWFLQLRGSAALRDYLNDRTPDLSQRVSSALREWLEREVAA